MINDSDILSLIRSYLPSVTAAREDCIRTAVEKELELALFTIVRQITAAEREREYPRA